MLKILGIIGSPRKLGNSEIIIKEISRLIKKPHELNLVRLHDLKIKACKGCYQCLIKGKCVLDDDFGIYLKALVESDAIIVATPTYCLGANASLRNLVNRAFALNRHINNLWDKPAIGIGISGINGKEGYTLLDLENFLALTFVNNKSCVMLSGALPGEIFLNNNTINIATNLAETLLKPDDKDKISNESSCPLCGGKTFRFHENNKVTCMLCSNSGTISFVNNKPIFSIKRGEHAMILSREDVEKHIKWLLSMKDRFIKHKKELKEITLKYIDDGHWVK